MNKQIMAAITDNLGFADLIYRELRHEWSQINERTHVEYTTEWRVVQDGHWRLELKDFFWKDTPDLSVLPKRFRCVYQPLTDTLFIHVSSQPAESEAHDG